MKRKEVALFTLAVALIIFSIATFAVNIYFHYQNPATKQITGNAGATAEIRLFVGGGVLEPFNFTSGWNFLSFYVQMYNYSIEQALSSLGNSYDYIQEWDTATQEFKVWSRLGAKQFTYLNKNKSYLIHLVNAKNMTFLGDKFNNYNITLQPYWETPNYVYEYNSRVDNSSGFYGLPFSYMQKWNSSAQEFMVYSKYSAEPPFRNISGAEGYFIYTTAGGTIKYVRI